MEDRIKNMGEFADTVWEAIKGDHNDLRRQAIIIRAAEKLLASQQSKSNSRKTTGAQSPHPKK